MTKTTLSLFSLALVLIFSCNTSDSLDQTSTQSSPEKEKPESLNNLTEKEKQGMRLLKRRQEATK